MRLSVAPMVRISDSVFRRFCRLLSRRAVLYTEMLHARAVLNNPSLLDFHPVEQPLVVQLAGGEPELLRRAATRAIERGHQEVNFNLGCPSPRATQGGFGACLFKDMACLASCLEALRAACPVVLSVKLRLGVDEIDTFPEVVSRIDLCRRLGVDRIIIHARKAWLKGVSPRQNRNKPRLDYHSARRIKRLFPGLRLK